MRKKDFDKLAASVKQAGKIKRGKLKPERTSVVTIGATISSNLQDRGA